MQIPELFEGRPVFVRKARGLRDTCGNPADAATSIRGRLIELDAELDAEPAKRTRILFHECFHFVWVRLGNAKRLRWEEFLRREVTAGARGEAGWSAEWRRRKMRPEDVQRRTRRWREYCCESFCDTAAFLHTGEKSETTLAPGRLLKRDVWFRKNLGPGPFPI